MSANGGFPPIKLIEKKETKKDVSKERFFAPLVKNVDIKKILTTNIVKPMIEVQRNEIDVIESL